MSVIEIPDPILASEVAKLKQELTDAGTWPPSPKQLLEEHGLAAYTCGQLSVHGEGEAIEATAAYRRDAYAMLLAELIETGTIAKPGA